MDNISYISKTGRMLLLVATLLEVIFFPTMENIVGCAVMIYGWLLFESLIFKRENFFRLFLPTVAVTGYIVMYFFLPLIMTLTEAKPLTYNFQVPYTTFFNQFLNINIIVLAYCWCKRVYRPNNLLNRIWKKIGYFRPPTDRQLWCIAIVSLVFFVLAQIRMYNIDTTDYTSEDMRQGAEGGGVFSFFSSLSTYFMLPICFFFRKLYGSHEKRIGWTTLIAYFAVIVAVALISTRRSPIAQPLFSMAIIWLFLVIIENRKIITTKSFFKYSVIVILVGGPLSNFAMAMALSRGEKDTSDAIISMMQNSDELHAKYNLIRDLTSNGGDNSYSWSENYVNNVFFDRFCNLRVQDATLYYADKLGYNNPDMHEYMKDRFLFGVPTPIVHAIGEKKVNRTTPVDLMLTRYFHGRDGIVRIGNMVSGDTGSGLYWIGYWYYPVALIIYFMAFYFLSSLIYTRQNSFVVPVPILCAMHGYFMYFVNSYGITSSIEMMERKGWMSILVFCFFYFVIRKLVK